MFLKNVKVNKVDTKRLKAEAYFNSITTNNNTVGSISSSSKHSFWTFNRLKILCSALTIALFAFLTPLLFPMNTAAFFALIGYTYIVSG